MFGGRYISRVRIKVRVIVAILFFVPLRKWSGQAPGHQVLCVFLDEVDLQGGL